MHIGLAADASPMCHCSIIIHFVKFLQPFNYNFVCWQPVNAIELFFAEPAGGFMLLQRQTTTLYMTPETMHGKMKLRVIVFNGLHQSFHNDPCFQLLPYLTLQSLFWCLSGFHLPAREFPAVLIVAISSLGGEDAPLVIVYNRRHGLMPLLWSEVVHID